MDQEVDTKWRDLVRKHCSMMECSICCNIKHCTEMVCGEHEEEDEGNNVFRCDKMWCKDCFRQFKWTNIDNHGSHTHVSVSCPFCRQPFWVKVKKSMGVDILFQIIGTMSKRLKRLHMIAEIVNAEDDDITEMEHMYEGILILDEVQFDVQSPDNQDEEAPE